MMYLGYVVTMVSFSVAQGSNSSNSIFRVGVGLPVALP